MGGSLLARPYGQAVHCGVPDDAILFPLVSFFGPPGSLPFGQARDLVGGQSQGVKGSEQSTVPLPPAEADAMSPVVVVETGIFCFGGVEVAVEGVNFLPDLEDQMSLQQGVEVLGVLRAWLWKHLLVDEHVDASTFHVEGAIGFSDTSVPSGADEVDHVCL